MKVRLLGVIALWLGLVGGVPAQLSEDAYEQSPTLRAGQVLQPLLAQSGHHRVEDRVLVEGNMFQFDLESSYGFFQVRSLPMLATRTHELRTLAQAIGQYKVQDDQFADQLRGELTYNARSLVDVVVAPFSMAAQLASNLSQTAEELGEFPNPGSSPSPGYIDTTSMDVVTGTHKRNIAFQLDLDAYSTNPKVQEFLNTVASARSRGHFNAGVSTIRVPSVELAQVSKGKLDTDIKNAMRQLTPAELDEAVREQLVAMGIGPQITHGFVTHNQFSPRHKVAIVAHLDFMRGIENRDLLVRSMLAAQSETDALSYEYLTRMLAYYHEQRQSIKTIKTVAALPVAVTTTDQLLVVMPIDYLYWNRENDEIFDALARRLANQGYPSPMLVINGNLSDRARAGLRGHGYEITENLLNLARDS